MIQSSTLQVEFKSRQRATKFLKSVKKHKNLAAYFNGKAERCIWFVFETDDVREAVKLVLFAHLPKAELRYRDSGVDYLFIN